MDETKLYQKCKDIYNHLKSIYHDESLDSKETISKMFNYVDGYVSLLNRNYSIYFNGSVNDYTLDGEIYTKYSDTGYIRLVEDLTMAYYRTHGGTSANNTYEFLDKLSQV